MAASLALRTNGLGRSGVPLLTALVQPPQGLGRLLDPFSGRLTENENWSGRSLFAGSDASSHGLWLVLRLTRRWSPSWNRVGVGAERPANRKRETQGRTQRAAEGQVPIN